MKPEWNDPTKNETLQAVTAWLAAAVITGLILVATLPGCWLVCNP